MRSLILFLGCAALALAGPADAKSRPRRHPAPPPRVWLLLNEDQNATLRYGFGHQADARRTNLACENSGVIKVEQFVPGRGGATLVIDSGGESEAAPAQAQADTAEQTSGTGVGATFPLDSPVIQAFARTGSLRLAVGALTFILPPAPRDQVERFMKHCAP